MEIGSDGDPGPYRSKPEIVGLFDQIFVGDSWGKDQTHSEAGYAAWSLHRHRNRLGPPFRLFWVVAFATLHRCRVMLSNTFDRGTLGHRTARRTLHADIG